VTTDDSKVDPGSARRVPFGVPVMGKLDCFNLDRLRLVRWSVDRGYGNLTEFPDEPDRRLAPEERDRALAETASWRP
jgi:hypothetical protein